MAGEKERTIEPGKFRQFLAAMTVNLSALAYGTMVGWQSPVTPQLQSEDPPVGTEPMSDDAASWLTGILCLSGTFVTLVMGPITERCGRKLLGSSIAVPFCASWLLMIFGTHQIYLYIARFLAGAGGAVTLFVVPLYVSEISCDEIRGMLGSLLVFSLNIGILLAYILGAFLSFRMYAVVALIIPLLFLGLFVLMPETPVYLVRRNRMYEATRSLTWLKGGHQAAIEREISRLQAEAKEMNDSSRSVGLRDLFRDRATIKGLIITLGLFGGQQLCGIFAMISYTETIFKLAGSSLSPNISAIIVGAIQVFGSYLSTSLMERMGRRPLLLVSCLGMGICHFSLGTFCYLQTFNYDVTTFRWIPILSLSFFVITYCLGMGPGPYIVTAEIFSRDVLNLATTIGLFFVWIMAFVVVKFFPNVVALLDMHGCFFLLGTFCIGSFIFTFALIPETKGRSRQFILDKLNGVTYAIDETRYVVSKSKYNNASIGDVNANCHASTNTENEFQELASIIISLSEMERTSKKSTFDCSLTLKCK